MAKPGFDKKTCSGCLRSGPSANGWALCIGAGASAPVLPLWPELVSSLLKWSDNKLTNTSIKTLLKSVNLESLVQAVFHRAALPSYKAAQLISQYLYANLKSKLSKDEWMLAERLFTSFPFGQMSNQDAATFLGSIVTRYPNATPLQLAEVIAHSIQRKAGPSAVLSFNAEPLLFVLTDAYIRTNTQLPKRKFFDTSLRGISYRKTGRIPYHFCHGLLPLPGTKPKISTASIDKLVFSEAEYLSLASSAFSWQSAVFLQAAMSHILVFVGLSFTDPNLRRWLGFVHANRI